MYLSISLKKIENKIAHRHKYNYIKLYKYVNMLLYKGTKNENNSYSASGTLCFVSKKFYKEVSFY